MEAPLLQENDGNAERFFEWNLCFVGEPSMPLQLTSVLASLTSELPIERITKEQYQRAIRRFGEHIGAHPTTDNLNIDQINAFLVSLQERLGPVSVRNYRTSLIRIWNFAHETLNLVGACPTRRIRRPKKPEAQVIAWEKKAVGQLLRAARGLNGSLKCGIPANVFMVALVNLSYDTGLRPSDTRLLEWDQFDGKRRLIRLSQHKTGGIHTCKVRPETKRSLDELRKFCSERMFPIGKTGVWKWEQRLYASAAKLGFKKRRRQGIGTLRKTHATEVYLEHGLAAAAQSLGHRGDISTARQHYIDSSTIKGYLPSKIGYSSQIRPRKKAQRERDHDEER